MRRAPLAVAAAVAVLAPAPAADAAISGVRAKEWVAKIAAVGQRPAGSYNEWKAGRIVRNRLTTLGYEVSRQRFRLPNGRRSRNWVGRTDGPLRVVIVAHIDGVHGTRAANDNGSGVGVLLEVARELRRTPGVLVAALGAEERMVTGSPYHLGSLRLTRSFSTATKDGVRLALSIDMVGVGPTFNVRGLEASPNRSARKLLRAARTLGIPASYLRDTGQSDHDDLTRGGLPAAWITWRWDPCWHQPCDQIGRIKVKKLRLAGRVVKWASLAAVD